MTITLTQAEAAINAAKGRAVELGVPMSIAVVDAGGHLVAFARQDDANLVSLDIAIGKAYTSAVMRMPTADITELVQPGAPLYNLAIANTSRPLVTFAGGHPLGHPVTGAIGISGGTVEQDDDVARAALDPR
ncbi:heme-binding protein [Streptomyces sp. NPDC005962]|uniref:GlcG/HbpS family heme-binding protein n=1 Tax=Streptomyces sp. NPDC005962 TaxID=3154466 RepID=UPI0033E1F7E0